MYQHKIYGNLVVAYFTGEITLEDAKQFATDASKATTTLDHVFLIALPINVTGFPQNMASLLNAARDLQNTSRSLDRWYTIEISKIMTFIANIVTQIMGIKSKVVMKDTIEELLEAIEYDAENIPELHSSIHYLDNIRTDVETLKSERA